MKGKLLTPARSAWWLLAGLVLPGGAIAEAQPAPANRWTAATPDEMADHLLARARRGGDDALAALVAASALDDRATFGKVRDGLDTIGKSGSPLADEARWLSARLKPEQGTPWTSYRRMAYDVAPDPAGLVKSFAILGPFSDTGGGLMRREGPEAPGQSWADSSARYAHGIYDVAWRRVLPDGASARGIPLDLYISPRNESCTYLASKVTVASAQPMRIHVGSTGAVRLMWDGQDLAAREDVHARLVLDRLTVALTPTAGDHLLALKVCSAAVNDDGRVRVRFTDDANRPLPLATSSSLAGINVRSAPPPPVEEPPPPPKGKGFKAPPKGKAPKAAPPKPAAPVKGKGAPKGKAPPPPPGDEGEGEERSAPPPSAVIVPPAGVRVIPTALEKAIALADPASVDQVIAASIVRTLGGADDAVSPRAPGLLDRVTRAAEVTPDQVAIAGWISPFGANRSGWLELARSRAKAAGDKQAEGFAQRRLVASQLGSRYVDWALTASREEPLASAPDAEARLIRALVKKQLGSTGFGRAAYQDLADLEASEKDKTPIAALSELLSLSRTQREVHQRVARRLAAIEPDAVGPNFVGAFRTDGAAALEKATAATLSRQTDVEDLGRIGRELADAGSFAWAREVFYLATQVGPNRSTGFIGLAFARQALAAAEAREGKPPSEDPALANASLARARDLEPSDASIKAEIAFRQEGQSGPNGVTEGQGLADERFMVKPEVFLKAARANPAKLGEIVDRQLHWVRVVTYHPDQRVSQLMHYSREIVIEPRTEADLYENAPTESDETELLLARVHRKDGTVVMPEEQSTGGRKPSIRWPELHTGDVVEVAVRAWTSGPVGRRGEAPFWFIDYVGSTDTHPILYNEVVVEAPQGSPLAIDVLNGKADRIETGRRGGSVFTRYIWDKPPSVPDEPLAPKLSESLPVVTGSTFKSWGDFREWYRAAVKGFTEPDDQVRHLAAELTKGKSTREQKLEAIFNFVADDIRYVNYVSGEWWLPNRPQELLARRQGDCDDKAMLLITLLKAIGIEANEVLVQTRYTAQPSLLKATHAAIPLFDHGIAFLPGPKGKPGTWLDATSPESRLGPVPSMDARTLAFFIDEGPAQIIETPLSSPDDHGVDADWTITLSPTGAGDLVAKERHTGDAAFELRMNLKQEDGRATWVEQNIASGWFPTVQVTGDVDFKPDLAKGAAILAYKAHSEGLARREGRELAVALAESSTLTSQLAPLVKRTLPVVLPARLAPAHETRTITIQAPPGYAFAELPPNGDVPGGEFGKAHLEFKRGKGKGSVVVKRSVVFDMSTIPVDKYQKWRGWLQHIDGLMHRTVRLIPDEKAGPQMIEATLPPRDPAAPVAPRPKAPAPPKKK